MRAVAALSVLLLGLAGCGYQIAGRTNSLPASIRVLAVPPFENHSRTPQVSQSVTAAVAREFLLRGHYRLQTDPAGADAVLHGNVLSVDVTPVAFDQASGRATMVEVVVHVQAWLTQEPQNKELFRADDLVFRDQYQISTEQQDFFEEDQAALARLSQSIAQTMVADILEAF